MKLIGYDAVNRIDPAILEALPPPPPNVEETDSQRLERYWRLNPSAMEEAREAGPRLTGEVRRMVTLNDHETLLENHPLVTRARARLVWAGAWYTVLISTLLEGGRGLDDPLHGDVDPGDGSLGNIDEKLWEKIVEFHRIERLPLPPRSNTLTARRLLRVMVEQYRMVGSEVFLEIATFVPITFALSIRAKKGYFRSELKQALSQLFSSDQEGFFEPGRLGFGEDLFASDIIEATMAVEGVEVACLNRFKRVGAYDHPLSGPGHADACENLRGYQPL